MADQAGVPAFIEVAPGVSKGIRECTSEELRAAERLAAGRGDLEELRSVRRARELLHEFDWGA